ncbi:MAG: T9SS type A sorting domain-containing protein, partial [Bacteroidota bacterium]|nr:T9SS type A sorting domain-containing protein [Bacteroidota bacterium]
TIYTKVGKKQNSTYIIRNKISKQNNTNIYYPEPTEFNKGQKEDEELHNGREAYINHIHRTAAGVDWRTVNRSNSEAQYFDMMNLRGGVDSFFNGKLKGHWHEKGSANNAGRTTCMDVDTVNNLLYIGSDQGNIWRGNSNGTAWKVLNDKLKFGGLRMVKVLYIAGGKKRILAVTSNNKAYYSDDEGAHWNKAAGLDNIEKWGNIEQAVVANDSQKTVYILAHDWNYTSWNAQTSIYSSKNQGKTFNWETSFNDKIYAGSSHFAIWTAPYGSGKLYILVDDSLYIKKYYTDSLSFVSTIPVSAKGSSYLAGLETQASTYIYAYINDSLFYSVNAGQSWTFQSYLNKNLFNKSFYCDLNNPNNIYLGDMECWISRDAGKTFKQFNKWGEYYGDVQYKLHADIQSILAKKGKNGQEIIYINTDGGTYYSSDGLQSVENISLKGLNVSQYYSVYTAKSDPQRVYAGAQDQGFQACTNDLGGTLDFVQTYSGDYGHLVSGDSGNSVWCNYPGFTMYYNDIVNNYKHSDWSFSCKGQVWIPPLAADPDDNRVCWVGGGSDANDQAHLYKIIYDNTNKLKSTEESFDFGRKKGDRISALAFSPINHQYKYVMSDQGLFWKSTDGGQSWDTTQQFKGPGAHYLYGAYILPSTKNKNTIYIGGSGYSTAGFWMSTDNGNTFFPRVSGLPNTMVFELAMDTKEEYIFAATDAGPYAYCIADSAWKYIGSTVAPDQTYWSVEFIDRTQTARFATYGRGIWDFNLGDPTSGISKIENNIYHNILVYPNPATNSINIQFNATKNSNSRIEIYDNTGRLIYYNPFKSMIGNNLQTIDIADYTKGLYYIIIKDKEYIESTKFEVR